MLYLLYRSITNSVLKAISHAQGHSDLEFATKIEIYSLGQKITTQKHQVAFGNVSVQEQCHIFQLCRK